MSLIQEALEKANRNVGPDSVIDKNPPKAQRPKLTPQREEIRKKIEQEERVIERVQKARTQKSSKRKGSGLIPLFIIIGVFLALGTFWVLQPAQVNTPSPLVVGGGEVEPAFRTTDLDSEEPKEIKKPKTNFFKRNTIKENAFISQAAYQFSLTGITQTGEEKFALIDNQIVGIGDLLRDGIEVHTINDKSVILKGRGREITLRL